MTVRCSRCNSRHLIEFRTVKHEQFDEPGYRECARCKHVMAWHLDEGQPPLIGNNRLGRRTKE